MVDTQRAKAWAEDVGRFFLEQGPSSGSYSLIVEDDVPCRAIVESDGTRLIFLPWVRHDVEDVPAETLAQIALDELERLALRADDDLRVWAARRLDGIMEPLPPRSLIDARAAEVAGRGQGGRQEGEEHRRAP